MQNRFAKICRASLLAVRMGMGEVARNEDDELVFEADVILSQSAANEQLYLLQYPLRTTAVPIGTERAVEGISVRPSFGRVEIQLAVLPSVKQLSGTRETCGASFDDFQERAEDKAIGATQVLRSQPANSKPHANYAASSFIADAPGGPIFVIAPLHSVAQLRPAFDYLDERAVAIARQRASDRAARANVRFGNDSIENKSNKPNNEIAPLQVSFRRRESERAAQRRKNSHMTLARREAEEPWLPVKYKPIDVDVENAEEEARRRVFRNARVTQVLVKEEVEPMRQDDQNATETNYLDLFQAHTRSIKLGSSLKAASSMEPLSLRALQQLPTSTAVTQLVNHARIVKFEDLLHASPSSVTPEEILNTTRTVAVCVRGCWIAKNGPRSVAAMTRKGAERFEAARTLIHNLFRKSRIVTTESAMKALGPTPALDEERVRAVLAEVARRKRKVGWELKLEDDPLFQQVFRRLVSDQNADWERRLLMANNLLNVPRRD